MQTFHYLATKRFGNWRFKIIKKKHHFADLFVLVPGDIFRGEDEPVVPAATLHDPQVVDRHVAFPDHLQSTHVNRSLPV